MPELNDSDLDKLFRTAGHSAPRTNLADQIMARVAVTPLVRATEVKALIGKRTWWAIALCASALVSIVMLIGTSGTSSAAGLEPLWGALSDRTTIPQGNWPQWMIGVSVCLLMLALMDRVLGQRSERLRN